MTITALKCENCGASDFKPHSKISEFLVCSSCGSQYSKGVRQISDDLPFDLKVVTKSNRSTIIGNNLIVKGDYNKITGNNNIILGNRNTCRGLNNISEGDYNTMVSK